MTHVFIGVFVPDDATTDAYLQTAASTRSRAPHSPTDVTVARILAHHAFGTDRIVTTAIPTLLTTQAAHEGPLFAIAGIVTPHGAWVPRADIDETRAHVRMTNREWAMTLLDAVASAAATSFLHLTLSQTRREHDHARPAAHSR